MRELMTKLAALADAADARGDVETAEQIDAALQVIAKRENAGGSGGSRPAAADGGSETPVTTTKRRRLASSWYDK